jgi:hypothetical protein
MVDQRASGTLSGSKGGFGNADGLSFTVFFPGPSGDKYILGNGDGDVVHVNFFTVGDTNTLGDGDGG